jgi:hypothetical protein
VAIAINYLAYRSDYVWGVSVLLSFAGAVILVLAASLASVALARAGEVRVVPRLPADLPAWLVAMLGSAGAVVLFLYEQRFAPSGWRLVTSMWGPAMALLVPATAAVAVPRRFGAAVLAGWIGGSAALVLRGLLDDPANRGQILLFACTLLALLLVMIPFSRAAPTADVERTH